jgi:signal transduction histidine kinase
MNRLSLRVRLASLIGLMLIVCGAALLAISYGLVSSNLSAPLPTKLGPRPVIGAPTTSGTQLRVGKGAPNQARTSQVVRGTALIGPKAVEQSALRKRTLDQLVTQYLAVLAGVVLVAVALGWLLAGRLLRSVRRMTAVARRVTGSNLDERIGLHGPRDELRELADTFDGMLARLDGVFAAQRRFVADASHELRTPLAAMRAEVEVLAADPHAALADVEAATRVLRRQLARSEELIEALLALARSEPELLAREPVDLAKIARKALDDAAAAARHLRIDTELDSAVVPADRRLLSLLVGNLVGNAVKHNHDGGWLELRTTLDAGRALLLIANSGSIVPAEELGDLTQAFRRGGMARIGDGHGLGLAIVAAVTNAHNGELTIEPISGGGLRVKVSLPLAVDVPLAATAAPDTNGAAGTAVSAGDRTS